MRYPHYARNGCSAGLDVIRRPAVAGSVPNEWKEIARQRKTIIGWPVWSDPEPLPNSTKAPTRRSELRSLAAETTETLIPLADSNGVGIEGVRLRINAWAYRRMHEVTAILEVPGHRRFVNIARVDAWPADPHLNVRVRQHHALRHLPPISTAVMSIALKIMPDSELPHSRLTAIYRQQRQPKN